MASLAAFALFLALGARTASPSPERPAPSTLVYIQDQGGPGAPVRALWATRADAGLDWAREATAAALDAEESFEGLRLGSGVWQVSDAPAVTLPPPRAFVTQDTVVDGRRRLSLAVDPGLDAESVGFGVTAPTRIESLGDATLGADGSATTRVWHHGSPADSLFVLTVVQDPGLATLDLEILQHHQRPWELVGGDAWARPADLAPNVMNQSDRAVVRSQLRLLLNGVGGELQAVPADTAAVAGTPPDTAAVGVTPPDTSGTAPSPPDTTGATSPPDTTRPTTPPDTTAGAGSRRSDPRPGR